MNFAIILAAGKSRRLKGINKIFYRVRGKPLIFYTILAFEKNPLTNKIILVIRGKDLKRFFSLVKKYSPPHQWRSPIPMNKERNVYSIWCGGKFKKVIAIIQGGKERQDSAFRGLKAAGELGAKAGDLILFHNGANPLISQKEISEVIKAARKHKAALVAQPIKDTLKKISKEGLVLETVDRKNIYSAQTPQAIEYKLAKEAFERAAKNNFYGTDDVSLVERIGKKVKLVPCPYRNIKATTKEDLEIIETLSKNI